MTGIRKIGVIGAGAVGAYIVMGLYDKFGDDFFLIAKGERKKRLEGSGLCINGRTYMPKVLEPGCAKPDLLFVTLKYGALEGALDDIEAASGANTVIVSLMNGVDSEEIIASRTGTDRILPAMIKIASTRKGNSISFPLPRGEKFGIFAGEADPYPRTPGQERAHAVRAVFDGTDVVCHVSDDIMAAMWDKYAINISRNLPQAVIGAGCGIYDDSEYIRDLSIKLRREVASLAAARGITIPEKAHYAEVLPSQRYSTLQDLDAGRTTEIEMFSGAFIRMARKLGVPCPYNEVMYDLIKALEEKNAGRFDY